MIPSLFSLLLLAVLPSQALAADYDRAITTSTWGGLAPAAGVAAVGVAFAASRGMNDDQQSAMALASTMVALPLVVIGPPVMTGGAMRARKALSEQGVVVSDLPGWISWGCFAGVLLAGSAYPVDSDADPQPWMIAQGSLFVAGYAAGAVQHFMARSAHREAPAGVSVGLTLVPILDEETRGLALGGRF